MQVNPSGSPLQLRLEPAPYRANALTLDQQAKRAATASAAEKVFTETQRQLSEGQRVDTQQRTRAPIYRQVQRDLEDVAARLGGLQQALSTALSNTGASAVTSPDRLNLGLGGGLSPAASYTPPTPPPAPIEDQINPTQKLNTQPFETAITSGTFRLAFQVNGGVSTAASITINKATQSLDDVLTALSNITIGGVKPLTATFDAAAQKVDLKVDSTTGTRFDFTITGGTSNFRTQIGADNVQTQTEITANAAIVDSATITKYNRLTVAVEGVGTQAFTTLQVSSAGLSTEQKVDELVGQLNAGLGALGITAVNAGGGKLGFTQYSPADAAAPTLGVTLTEANRAGAVKLGLQGGFTTEAKLRYDPNLTESPAPVPGPGSSLPATAGTPTGLLGPDATLGQLAGQLGLQTTSGHFELTVNGQQLSFSQDQTVNDVLAGINASGKGLFASYDVDAAKITVLNTEGGTVEIADRTGNLASSLGIDADAAQRNDAALGDSLRSLANALDGVSDLIETSTRRGTGLDNDRLLADLQASLSGLFASSTRGPLIGLGDLGFTRHGGEVAFDASKLQDLLADRRGDVETFLGSFIGEKVAPLVRAGSRALTASEEIAPAEAEAAARSVRVRGEIAKLQVQQQMLVLEQQSFESLQKRLARQHEALEQTAQELEERNPSGLQRDFEDDGRTAELLGRDRSAFTAVPTVVTPSSSTPPSPGFASFGGSNASTA